MLRLLYASDLHGSTLCFKKLVRLAEEHKADAVLVGGDLTGKTMFPIVREPGAKYRVEIEGETQILDAGEGVKAFERDLETHGAYSIRVSREEYQNLVHSGSDRYSRFMDEMKGRLIQWISYAQERLTPRGIRLILIFGNDDAWELDELLRQFPFVENPESGVIRLNEHHEVIGESAAIKNVFFDCPRDISEEEIEARLRARIQQLKDPGRAVFLVHTPPFNSGLDLAWKLDSQKRIVTSAGSALKEPVGSHGVRRIIEEAQPLLSLHGHIHESPGRARIGRTVALNVGSDSARGFLHADLILLDRDTIAGEYRLFQ